MSSSTTILLIEEDIDLRSLIRSLLERMGYWVIAVPRTEALPRVLTMAAGVDLVVSDVTVPDGESIGLTQELLAGLPALPALVIATDDTELVVQRQFSKKRTRFLRKPFSFDELRAAVEATLDLAPPGRGEPAEMSSAHVPSALAGTGRAPMRRVAAWGLIAAAALVTISGIVLRGFEAGPPPIPERVESTVLRGEAFSVVEPTGDRPGIPRRLAWKEIAGAALYRVEVRSVEHEVLWESTSQLATLAVPDDLARLLRIGVVYFWTVEALDVHGNTLVQSGVARFQVVPSRSP